MTGFYLMHRGWQDNPAFNNEPFSRRDAWVWLIEEAKYKDTPASVGGKTITLKRGQLSHSLRFMAKAWKWDDAKVRRFLARLQADAMIECVTDAGQTVITVCNYEQYQTLDCVTDAPTDAATTQHRRSGDANENEGNQGNNSSDADASGAAGAAQPEGGEKVIDLKARIFGPAREWLVQRAGVTDQKARKLLGQWCRDYGDGATLQALQNAARASPEEPISWITGVLRGTAGKRFGQPFSTVEMLGDMADDDRSRRARAEADLTAPYYALPGA